MDDKANEIRYSDKGQGDAVTFQLEIDGRQFTLDEILRAAPYGRPTSREDAILLNSYRTMATTGSFRRWVSAIFETISKRLAKHSLS